MPFKVSYFLFRCSSNAFCSCSVPFPSFSQVLPHLRMHPASWCFSLRNTQTSKKRKKLTATKTRKTSTHREKQNKPWSRACLSQEFLSMNQLLGVGICDLCLLPFLSRGVAGILSTLSLCHSCVWFSLKVS